MWRLTNTIKVNYNKSITQGFWFQYMKAHVPLPASFSFSLSLQICKRWRGWVSQLSVCVCVCCGSSFPKVGHIHIIKFVPNTQKPSREGASWDVLPHPATKLRRSPGLLLCHTKYSSAARFIFLSPSFSVGPAPPHLSLFDVSHVLPVAMRL